MSKKVFLYILSAKLQNKEISKIGISNNVKKRIGEINRSMYFRSWHYQELIGIQFSYFFSVGIDRRSKAKKLERKVLNILKPLMLESFGREVFAINHESAKDIVSEVASDHIN